MNITSVSSLDDILSKLNISEGMTRFFRGHSNYEFELTPSIYRESYLIENEDKIIKDAILNCPDSFAKNSTLFDKLVTLQHYGYKTRLLDITMNALVALFFAVDSNEDKDGELIVFDIPTSEIKYDTSDRVAILSAISIRDRGFSIQEYIESSLSMGYASVIEYITKNHQYFNVEQAYSALDSLGEHGITRDLIKKGFAESIRNVMSKGIVEAFNKQKDIVKLIHDIRNDKGNFDPIIESNDFNRVLCVRAKLENQRIIRQQGAFLLFGMQNESKLKKANVEQTWIKEKILIPKEYKHSILHSLKSFGISKQTLFPELESQAIDIIKQYKPTTH